MAIFQIEIMIEVVSRNTKCNLQLQMFSALEKNTSSILNDETKVPNKFIQNSRNFQYLEICVSCDSI